tara:strand:- start:112 stop:288 length:177 start_codon:yes stop_codon:yes gene_type:complete
MPPLKQDLQNAKRDCTAVGKILDSSQTLTKQQVSSIKKFLNSIITVLNGLNDSTVKKP